jgi:hypothetical protein
MATPNDDGATSNGTSHGCFGTSDAACWDAVFDVENIKKNAGGKFQAKSSGPPPVVD